MKKKIKDRKSDHTNSNEKNDTSNPQTQTPTNRRKCMRVSDWIQTALTFVTICILIVYIVGFWNQSCQNKKLIDAANSANSLTKIAIDQNITNSKNSDSLNRKAIEIADSSMEISKKIADIQEKYTKIELRAYITIVEVVPYFLEVGRNTQIKIAYVNYGKTPAFNIKCFSGYRLGRPELIERDMKHLKEFKSIAADTKGTDLDGSFNCDFGNRIDSVMLDSIKNNKIQYFVFGYISYDDIFGDNHKSIFIKKYFKDEMNTYEYNKP